MEIYTIGFTQRTAEGFFGTLRANGIGRLMDVRRNNSSQLAGFTKRQDLEWFLDRLCGATYEHQLALAPEKELLAGYRKGGMSWDAFAAAYVDTLRRDRIEHQLDRTAFLSPTVLLCSEATAEQCHRRLAVEYLATVWPDVTPVHL